MRRVLGYFIVHMFVVVLIASAQSSLPQRAGAQRTKEIGYWIDQDTGLMWAGKDNGKDITWQRAMKYCRDLRLAGYSDWRLASLKEMEGIYDKDALAPGIAGEGKTLRPFEFHVKGNLFLSGAQWTSTRLIGDRGRPSGYAWRFSFVDGRGFDGDELSFSENKRALCVRTIFK